MLRDRMQQVISMVALLVCLVFAFSCEVQASVPSSAECKAARAKLAELTSDDYKALKAKTKTNEQVGDALAQYADNEESAAGKFALLQDAFQQYVLGKSVDKAESVYSKAQTVGGMEYALEMARPSRSKLSAYATSKNAPAKALKERIMADEKSFQRVGIVKAKLKKAPGDESLCEQLGIEYAAIGDWESALAAFVTAAGEVAKVADWELNGGKGVDYTAATVGAFWWKFADNFERRRLAFVRIRLHASEWYRVAVDSGLCHGNESAILEKRILAAENDGDEVGVVSYLLKDGARELQLVATTDSWQCLKVVGTTQNILDAWCIGKDVQGITEDTGPIKIYQPSSTLLARKILKLDGKLRTSESVEFTCKWDDDITIFLNGEIVHKQRFIGRESKTIEMPVSKFKKGKNVVAVEVVNGWGSGFFEMSIKVVTKGFLSGAPIATTAAEDEKNVSEGKTRQIVLIRSDEQGGEKWQYSVKEPEMGFEKWVLSRYNKWKSKVGDTGFCTPNAWGIPQGFKTRTVWDGGSGNLWLRKEFVLNIDKKFLKRVVIRGVWDDNVEMWLKGECFLRRGLSHGWQEIEIPLKLVNSGENVLYVKVTNTGGPGLFSAGMIAEFSN